MAHIIVGYNFKKFKKIVQKLKKSFPKENPGTIRHIYINLIEFQVLKHLFNRKFIEKIIKRNLPHKGIKRAWEIVLKEVDNLKKLFEI